MSLLHMPTPRITAPTRVCSPLGISKYEPPKPAGKWRKPDAAYFQDYKKRYPEKYALRQKIGAVRRSMKYYAQMDNDKKVASLKLQLHDLEAKRRELNRG